MKSNFFLLILTNQNYFYWLISKNATKLGSNWNANGQYMIKKKKIVHFLSNNFFYLNVYFPFIACEIDCNLVKIMIYESPAFSPKSKSKKKQRLTIIYGLRKKQNNSVHLLSICSQSLS